MRNSAFAAYRQSKLQGVAEASPIRLVSLMLEEAISCCNVAAAACDNGNIAKRGESISKALAIIDTGLLSALDMEKGGEIATNLASLYQHCLNQLMVANIESNPIPMRRCAELLSEIREGWRGAEALDRS